MCAKRSSRSTSSTKTWKEVTFILLAPMPMQWYQQKARLLHNALSCSRLWLQVGRWATRLCGQRYASPTYWRCNMHNAHTSDDNDNEDGGAVWYHQLREGVKKNDYFFSSLFLLRGEGGVGGDVKELLGFFIGPRCPWGPIYGSWCQSVQGYVET